MNIGFDLDKIFINYPPFIPDRLINRLYLKKISGTLVYRIPPKPEQLLRKLSHLHYFRPPMQENINTVKAFSRRNNKFFLISSRYSFLEKLTADIVKRYKLDGIFDGMFFNFSNKQPHVFKDEVIKKLHIDKYIDDDLRLLTYVAKNNAKATFFWLNKTLNKPLSKNLNAVTRISDILK